MSPIEANLQQIRAGIDAAIAGRRGAGAAAVRLVAVSKSQPAAAVRAAFAAGQRAFGENYAQEGAAKVEALADLKAAGIEWHFIGPLQSNKAKLAAAYFDWVQTIDRVKIAEMLSRHREGRELNVCVQVNISGEASKSGATPGDIPALARQVAVLPGLKLRGLMTIIEAGDDPDRQRAQFRHARELFDQLRTAQPSLDTLSMGMSQDYPLALQEGATMLRIGSAIFGLRS